MSKRLLDLINSLEQCEVYSFYDTNIQNIVDDSRKVRQGDLFVAINGEHFDSHKFIKDVVNKGAKAILAETAPPADIDLNAVSYIRVESSRKSLAILSASFFNYPAKKLKIIGITGTDGKTTTSNMIYWILKTAKKKVGLISTVSAKIGEKEYDTGFHVTNPEPIQLQGFLQKMVDRKCQYAVLEVTSHGLDQERAAGINFNIGVLTNVTHEHIDYHKTFQNYILAKSKLFQNSSFCVLNKEDKHTPKIAKLLKTKEISYYSLRDLPQKIQKAIKSKFDEYYNQQNASAACVVTLKLNISQSDIAKALESFPGVEGRMQEIKNHLGIRIIVDFAHTPNALENVLTVLSRQKEGDSRLISVFGCAGERDIQKRPMMAKISTTIADISVFTSEDPRQEDINQILLEMIKGVNKNKHTKYICKIDRGEAISFAIKKAKPDDIVLICGKGHEKSMNIKGIEYPWSDYEFTVNFLKNTK